MKRHIQNRGENFMVRPQSPWMSIDETSNTLGVTRRLIQNEMQLALREGRETIMNGIPFRRRFSRWVFHRQEVESA